MELTHNFEGLSDALKDLASSQIPFAISKTMNDSLYATRREVIRYMDSGIIEGGATRFTKQGMLWQKSYKNRLAVMLWFADNRSYMGTLMEGGVKEKGGRKLAEPAKGNFKKLNRYGNFPRNYIKNLMTQANVARKAQWSKTYGPKKSRTQVGAKGIQLGASKGGTYGLWQWKKGKPTLLVYMGRTSYQQRKTFDGRTVAQDYFAMDFNRNYSETFGKAVESTFRRRLAKLR